MAFVVIAVSGMVLEWGAGVRWALAWVGALIGVLTIVMAETDV